MIRGDSANLLSLGAIDFGLIVDATVIMVENVFRHLAEPEHSEGQPAPGGLKGRLGTIAIAGSEVNRAIFFSATIIIVGFLPLFTMSGVEGHIFGPMAKTYAYALVGGLIATFTVSPALSAMMLPKRVEERDTLIVRVLRVGHETALRFGLRNRVITVAVTLAVLLGSGWPPGISAWNSCRSWRRATSTCAAPCPPRSPWRPATPTCSACAKSSRTCRRW